MPAHYSTEPHSVKKDQRYQSDAYSQEKASLLEQLPPAAGRRLTGLKNACFFPSIHVFNGN